MRGLKCYIFILFCCGPLYSQIPTRTVDSLLTVISKEKNDTLKVITYGRLNTIVNKTDPELGNSYLQKGLTIVKKMNWGLGYSFIYNALGSNYGNMGNHIESTNYYLKSLEYSDYNNRLKELSSENYLRLTGVRLVSLNNLTSTYIDQKNVQKALYYNSLAFKVPELNSDEKTPFSDTFLEFKGVSYSLLSDIYVLKKDTVNALKSLKKSLDIMQKLDRPNREATIWSSMGELTKDTADKIAYLFKAKEIWDKNKFFDVNYITNLNLLAEAHIALYESTDGAQRNKTGLLQKADGFLEDAIDRANSVGATVEIIQIYKNLSHLKQLENDFKSAYEYNVLYHKLNDSVFSQENKNTLAALESQNAMKVKDKDIEMTQIKLQAEETQNWLLITVLVLISFVVGILFYQNRLRKAKNEELEEANRIKIRFFNILNHDLRSPVGDLINFLHLKKDTPDLLDTQTEERLDKETMNAAENLLASMEDLLLWSKSQMGNIKFQPKAIEVDQLFKDIEVFFAGNKNAKLTFDNPKKLTLFTDENYLKTITRNLTSNAIKALSGTKDGKIDWKAYKENNTVIISITDNGPGGTSEQFKALYDDKVVVGIKTGLGLHLVRDMANAINCKLEITTQLKKGTSIMLLFEKSTT